MSTPLPICLAPQSDVLPHSYVIIKKTQHCQCCHALNSFSDLYVKTFLRSRLNTGKYVTNLRPLQRLEYNLPIETISQPITEVPFCHECNQPSLPDLPPLPIESPRLKLVHSAEGDRREPLERNRPQPRKPATLEDIFTILES